MQYPKTYCVIVSFNSENLDKLISKIISKDIGVILVENGNQTQIKQDLKKRLIYTKNKQNIGFARGSNIGIKYALKRKAKVIIILNPDIDTRESELIKLSKSEFDIVGPTIRYREASELRYDHGGKVNLYLGRAYHLESTKRNFDNKVKIDYVSGACMSVKDYVFRKIGLFDENYFLYYEDTDFCLRAKNAGMTIGISKSVIIDHELSSSIGKKSYKKLYNNLKSNFMFILLNVKFAYKPVAISYWIFLAFWTNIKFFKNNHFKFR